MSTPTTAKFEIAVPSTSGNAGAEQLFTLTLSLQALVEGETGGGEIQMAQIEDGISAGTQGHIPLPKDPPTATFQITMPSSGGTFGAEQVCTLALSVQVEAGGLSLSSQDDFEINMKAA